MQRLGRVSSDHRGARKGAFALVLAVVTAALALPGVAAADPSAGAASDTPTTTQAQPVSGSTAARGSTPGQSEGSESQPEQTAPEQASESKNEGKETTPDNDAAGPKDPGQETTSDKPAAGNDEPKTTTTNETLASATQASQTSASETPASATQAGQTSASETPASETPTSEPAPEASAADASVGTASDATGAGASEPEPTSSTEQTTTIDQDASATAVAQQQGAGNGTGNGTGNGVGNGTANGAGNGTANGTGNGAGNGTDNGAGNTFGHGNGAGNTNTDVRVDQPGTTEGISQANTAGADADATATADVETDGAATVTQNADASATASQSDIGNVQVSVRVDSPGDDGDVTQTNDATAASSATTSDASGHAAADATAVQDGVSNTVVSVRVFSPGDDGVVRQSNDAGATASAEDEAAASAVQDGVRNTYVGIRVQSPGERGGVEQSSAAGADAGPGGQVSVVSDGINTVVIADINAPALTVPDETTVWEWTWQWYSDESELGQGAPVVVSGNTWNWNWGNAQGGSVVQRQATEGETAGTWTWDWNWEREVPDWAWEWRQQATLACATCVWVWRWDWKWTGQPPMSSPAAPSDPPSGGREQTTSVTAVADAHADAAVTQVVEQDNEGATQFAGQIADVEQIADASALARQRLSGARLAGLVLVDDQGRTLVVTAQATVTTQIDQALVQVGEVVGDGLLDQWAGQHAVVLQAATAAARGDQDLATYADGNGIVVANAAALSINEQSVIQSGWLGDGLLDQWGGQLIEVVQVADALSGLTQKLDKLVSATAVASAFSIDLSVISQAVEQDGNRIAGIGSQTASQLAQVAQLSIADAATSQSAGRLATSDATAVNRSLLLQTGAQAMDGLSAFDLQDLLQQASVTQVAIAASSSSGGIGGPARTVNCSTIQQGAGQGIGSYVSVDVDDLTSFCVPPSPAVSGEAGPQSLAGSWSVASSSSIVELTMTVDDEVLPGHGTSRYRATPASFVPPVAAHAASWPVIWPITESARDAGAVGDRAGALSQVSSPVPSQAGFDSRPKGSGKTKDVAKGAPLPATDGPPAWATAFAGAAAAFGGSGIAAILAMLVLTPPLLRRVRDGAVVRRPISVSIPIDVPV